MVVRAEASALPGREDVPATAMKGPEAAAFLQSHFPTSPAWTAAKVWKYARNGVLPFVRLGQNYLFTPAHLLRWISEGGSSYAHGWRRKPGPKPGPKRHAKRSTKRTRV